MQRRIISAKGRLTNAENRLRNAEWQLSCQQDNYTASQPIETTEQWKTAQAEIKALKEAVTVRQERLAALERGDVSDDLTRSQRYRVERYAFRLAQLEGFYDGMAFENRFEPSEWAAQMCFEKWLPIAEHSFRYWKIEKR